MPIDNYRLLEKPHQQTSETEIRVKAQGRPFVYAAYAGKLLFEGKHKELSILATGPATAKAINAVEYIRNRVNNLSVIYYIENTKFVDTYVPMLEGLDKVELVRLVPTLRAVLTLNPTSEQQQEAGFMPAIPKDKMKDEEEFKEKIAHHFKMRDERQKNRVERGEDQEERRRGRRRRGGRGYRRGNRGRNRNYRGDYDRDRSRSYDDSDEEHRRRRRRGGRGYRRGNRGRNRNYRGDQDRRRHYRRDDSDYESDEDRDRRRNRGYRGRRRGNRGRNRNYRNRRDSHSRDSSRDSRDE